MGSIPGRGCTDFIAQVAQGVLPCTGWGVMASQLDLPCLTPLSVAGYGQWLLEAAHWATSVALLQVVDNYLALLPYRDEKNYNKSFANFLPNPLYTYFLLYK